MYGILPYKRSNVLFTHIIQGFIQHLLLSSKPSGRYVLCASSNLSSRYPNANSSQLQGGVSHVFVNLGSDHPSILEAMVKGQKEKKDQFPTIITCPNEVR
jgi:hypothetical protein